MIVVKSNARAVAQSFRKIRKDLSNNKSPLRTLAIRGQALARRLAPEKDGILKKGIYYRLFQNRMELISSVPGNFKYNFWVNQTAPYRTLNFPKGGWSKKSGRWVRYFRPGSVVVYGDASHKNTGTPGYFDLTIQKLERESGKVFDKHISKVLRAQG